MSEPKFRLGIAAVGDAADINCWSGIPYHFWQAALCGGWEARPWRLRMDSFRWPRRRWNATQWLLGRGLGGYQYSPSFLRAAEAQIPAEYRGDTTITFHQQFPRAATVGRSGGRLIHYLDATFVTLAETGALGKLPRKVQEDAAALGRENYAESKWVVGMARSAADSAVRDCGVQAERVKIILPGANFELPPDYLFSDRPGAPGKGRPLVLGFVGKDWRRKGLPFLLQVRSNLERMGMKAVVRAAGHCPVQLRHEPGLEYVGFIDKAREGARFLGFLADCDVGCLFSDHEPLGISTLEFLRAGVPVAGFAIEGLTDTLPPDAGFRFLPDDSSEVVASRLREAFSDATTAGNLRTAARHWSPLMTWERCIREWNELLTTGAVADPVRPWLGLEQQRSRVKFN